MRGADGQQSGMFSYVSPERRIPADHPLRPIREMTDEVLRHLSRRFAGLYAKTGRPSIAPEKLLRALLLQVLYSVRSERLLMEQLQYNLLFRWFVGLSMDDPVWDVTVFTKNRARLLRGDVADAFLQQGVGRAEWEAGWAMAKEIPGRCRATLGADKHYDDRNFVECIRTLNVTPHVAQKEVTALDARTTRHSGYEVSQRFRKRVEEVFGWLKSVGLCRQTRYRGRERVGWMFTFAVAA